ncbi:MAG: hypothetical protein V7K26_22250 [Nostoc sp.]
MKILEPKDPINRRQDERLIIVETAIHRVSCPQVKYQYSSVKGLPNKKMS